MNSKYELLSDDTLTSSDDTILYRIRALRDFGDVKAGDLGGYIAGEHNLSHDATCWVADNAQVYGSARVYDNARVFGNAQVYDSARVYGNARVYDSARVYGDAEVCGNAEVYGNTKVDFEVCENVQ
jgi:carbonic anhydrase/acetyltransferase-like protein (isoleucine patch superfamily)